MPLPSEPQAMGDTVAAKEYGPRVQAKTVRKASAAQSEKPVQAAPAKTPKRCKKTESQAALLTAAPRAEKTVVRPAKPAKAVQTSQKSVAPASQSQAPAPHRAPEAEKLGASRLRPPRTEASVTKPRLFVLDTNVLLHDPMSIFRFEEHDVFLPMMTLEELDNHKTGLSDIARNARQVSRSIDQLIESEKGAVKDGVPLNALGHAEARGRLFFETEALAADLPAGLPAGKADNMILACVRALTNRHPDKAVVLVSKDINMRIKAAALGMAAEDYFNDKTIDDTDLLYTGRAVIDARTWDAIGKTLESWQADGRTWYRFKAPAALSLHVNEFVTNEDASFTAQVESLEDGAVTLATLTDYLQPKNAVWGVRARNLEQSMALNLLMNPEIDFVTILGQAGTGKTLLTLAAALTQTLDARKFSEIIFTRATVSVGEDIGFLPGTEEEKMQPWMGALEDNLEVLNKAERGASDWSRSAANDLIRRRIRVKSMNFMRGRTFLNKLVIIDEAQNLSPKQMKTLITRAGPGSKIVCLGNIAQIDTPYLTEGSSGLTYVVDRFKGWKHAGHITLARGERSRLADYATDVL